MKKILKFTALSAVLLVLAGVMVSCNRDDDKPPQFYFEAYINGQRFVNAAPDMGYVQASYAPQHNSLAVLGVSSQLGLMRFLINNPSIGKFDSAYLFLGWEMLNWQDIHIFDSEYSWVKITEYDTVNQIVAGTFQFIGRFPLIDIRTSEYIFEYKDVKITEGRFRTDFFHITFPPFGSPNEHLHYLTQSQLLRLQTP